MRREWTHADKQRYAEDRADALGLLHELCRVFDSKDKAMLCALSHGQVTIDGWIIRPEHLKRWSRAQLVGRYARLCGQWRQLYGSTPVSRLVRSADSSRGA